MQGYDNSSYGEAFADVYDDWYGDISDVSATVDRLAALTSGAAATTPAGVLELGVGTGRLAIPLARRIWPATVTGIDSSAAMLDRLAVNQAGTVDAVAAGASSATTMDTSCGVRVVLGDMVDDLPAGPFDVIFVAFNTFFNLGTAERQQSCVHAVSSRLTAGGCFVVEADVPEQPMQTGSHVEVRSISADRVVLSVARYEGTSSVAEGQFIELTESGGVRLRPWSVRYVAPAEIDAMAEAAGLVLRDRWEDFAMSEFTDHSDRHVSVYTRRV